MALFVLPACVVALAAGPVLTGAGAWLATSALALKWGRKIRSPVIGKFFRTFGVALVALLAVGLWPLTLVVLLGWMISPGLTPAEQ